MIADRYGLLATFYFLAVTIVIANVFVIWVPKSPAKRRWPRARSALSLPAGPSRHGGRGDSDPAEPLISRRNGPTTC